MRVLRNVVNGCYHKKLKKSLDDDMINNNGLHKSYRLMTDYFKANIIPSKYQGIFIPSGNIIEVTETTVIGNILTDDGYRVDVVAGMEGRVQMVRGICYVNEYETLAFVTPKYNGENNELMSFMNNAM